MPSNPNLGRQRQAHIIILVQFGLHYEWQDSQVYVEKLFSEKEWLKYIIR